MRLKPLRWKTRAKVSRIGRGMGILTSRGGGGAEGSRTLGLLGASEAL